MFLENMFNECNLANFLSEQLMCWREVEKLKCVLVEEHLDFNLLDAFQPLDKGKKGFVTSLDLVEALEDYAVLGLPDHASIEYVNAFLQTYAITNDRNKDDGPVKKTHCPKMRFTDFAEALTPSDDRYLGKILQARKPSGFYFAGESFMYYRKLWQAVFKSVKLTDYIQTQLKEAALRLKFDPITLATCMSEGLYGHEE